MKNLEKVVCQTCYLTDRDYLQNMMRMYYMIKDYIDSYETHKTLETAIALCQFLLDTDQVLPQYKTLVAYLMLEGCLYDVGAWEEYMKLES